MKLANPCYQYVTDWFAQPLSPTHLLYPHINQKRLTRIIPEVASIIYRFFEDIPFFQITNLKMDIDSYEKYLAHIFKDNPDKAILMKKESWKHTKAMCDDVIRHDFDTIVFLMREHGVCRDIVIITEWIGYCIESLECISLIHSEYSASKKKKPLHVICESKDYFDLYS